MTLSTNTSDQTYSFDDYESLPTHRLHVHLLAGGAAGIMEHSLMFPIDSVKTRMQSLCACPERKCKTPVGGLFSMVKREGVFRPIRGISAVAGLAGPAHALYFTVYEKLKHYLTNGRPGFNQYAYTLSGCMATLIHDAVMNPAEVVKQRLQMWGSPYKGCVECARCLWKTEGICAFYRSYSTQLLMNVPFQTSHFLVYELVQERLNPRRRYDPKSHVVAGALAGGVAAAITTPLDVCKTALNTQDWRLSSATVVAASDPANSRRSRMSGVIPASSGAVPAPPGRTGAGSVLTARTPTTIAAPCGPIIAPSALRFFRPACCRPAPGPAQAAHHCPAGVDGFVDACRAVYRLRGARGFFGGIQARVMFQVPSTAVSWSMYEFFKYLLTAPESY